MRIISGKYKGKKLVAPKKLPVRPTTDFAKEALFNILNNYYHFDDIDVLDLFAGTGSISYEFASRGCENITAIDKDFGCVKYINKIAEELEFPIHVIKSDIFKFLENSKTQFTIIFADPPYAMVQEQFESVYQLVLKNDLLAENGFLIIEHSKHTDLSHLSNFSFLKKYGGSVFSFFEK
ncbi:16S rRNA (guanine(966)-N(2))-methyltransferase RsmD [Flavobacteriaceae bacterium R38]|nr:16S rRNA (guanine(966)-N(2))-methyltransferase RsmD [Flavobacteriaceae bacterium R38]